MKTLITACLRYLPSDSIGKNYSLTINSVTTNGKKIHFEVLKKYNEINANSETASGLATFETYKEAFECFLNEGGK